MTNEKGKYSRVVVGEFGCAMPVKFVVMSIEHPRVQMCGTPDWYPPDGLAEIVGPGRLSRGDHTNIWQVGIIELGSQLIFY